MCDGPWKGFMKLTKRLRMSPQPSGSEQALPWVSVLSHPSTTITLAQTWGQGEGCGPAGSCAAVCLGSLLSWEVCSVPGQLFIVFSIIKP